MTGKLPCKGSPPRAPPKDKAAFSFSGGVSTTKPINQTNNQEVDTMTFFNSAIDVLQTLVIALGAGLGIWGVINLLEGYGQDNPASKSQGMKQLMAGGGVALIGLILVPLLSGLFG
jgi:hypothetical protein